MYIYYQSEVHVGSNLLDAITSEADREKAKKNYDKALNGISHSTIEEYGVDTISTFESFYSPLYNEFHEIVGATAYARDITARI
jgi:hypothetical protein